MPIITYLKPHYYHITLQIQQEDPLLAEKFLLLDNLLSLTYNSVSLTIPVNESLSPRNLISHTKILPAMSP